MIEQLSVAINSIKNFLTTPTPITDVSTYYDAKTEASTNQSPSVLFDTKASTSVKFTAPDEPGKKTLVQVSQNTLIREKYKVGYQDKLREKDLPITEIVYHATAGGSFEGVQNWMYDGERAEEYKKGIALFHYLIGEKGEIAEIISPDYWVYHSSAGVHDKQTIGIELINRSSKNENPPTEQQYKSLFSLTFDYLFSRYATISRICSHNYNVSKYKGGERACPGPNFNWKNLDDELKKRNFTFKTYYDLRYEIKNLS